jgi:phosphatidylserine/phosphatidylglycerophosphate/cardiolipin synthase-like enzyme
MIIDGKTLITGSFNFTKATALEDEDLVGVW